MTPTTRKRRRAPADAASRLLEQVPVATNVLDRDLRIVLWNRGCEELLGWSADEVIGRDIRDVAIRPERREMVGRELTRLVATGVPVDGEGIASHRDGTARPVHVHAGALRDADGRVTGIVNVFVDASSRHAAEARLMTEEARFRALVQHAPDVILVLDAQGVITYNSPSLGETLGFSHDLSGHSFLDYVHPDDAERGRDALRRVAGQPDLRVDVELRVRDHTGTWRWFDASATNPGIAGGIDGIVVNARDVTAHKRAHADAERRARQHAAVARLGEHAITGVDPLALFDEAAGALRAAFGDVLVYAGRYDEHGRLELHTAVGFALPGGGTSIEVVPGGPGGLAVATGSACRAPCIADASATLGPEFDAVRSCIEALVRGRSSELGVMGIASREPDAFGDDDVHFVEALANVIGSAVSRLRTDRELQRVALRDPLTGLANRALLLDRIDQALARRGRDGRRIALLLLNVDRFKLVNETLGHEIGDELLVTVARRIKASVRREDTVARLGADEFAVLSEPVADVHEAVELAHRVASAVGEPVRHGGHQLEPSISIGIAVDGVEWDQALDPVREANTALHWAKEHGRSRFEIYDAGMRQLAAERLEVESDLRRAILAGELEAWYQPQVSVATGEIVAAEALVRWRHPERGLLAPAQFLHVAEDSGLIVRLGEQVLDAACSEAATWATRPGLPRSVSVNLATAHLTDPALVPFVGDLLAHTALPPERLTIEITEGTLLDDVDAALGALYALHQLGVRVSVDDFGTGYSSLRYLAQLPVDEVKIDRSFVQVLNGDPAPRAIVSAVVGMAHALGLVVVAEGVETLHQLDVLRELGCDVGQGYLWSRARTAEDFRACVAHRGCQAVRGVA
jgi:diguanylate cyclase (GGDEF)-like protein/PAS domain S-box-containing protein